MFDSTRNLSENALKAVRAYQDIGNAIDEAERAARAALNASGLALDAVSLHLPPPPPPCSC